MMNEIEVLEALKKEKNFFIKHPGRIERVIINLALEEALINVKDLQQHEKYLGLLDEQIEKQHGLHEGFQEIFNNFDSNYGMLHQLFAKFTQDLNSFKTSGSILWKPGFSLFEEMSKNINQILSIIGKMELVESAYTSRDDSAFETLVSLDKVRRKLMIQNQTYLEMINTIHSGKITRPQCVNLGKHENLLYGLTVSGHDLQELFNIFDQNLVVFKELIKQQVVDTYSTLIQLRDAKQELRDTHPNSIKKLYDTIKYKAHRRSTRLNVLLLGIPLSIKSGVTNAVKSLSKLLMNKGVNVVMVNHWWNQYYYWVPKDDGSGFNKKKFVKSSPFSLLNRNFPKGGQLGIEWTGNKAGGKLKGDYNFNPDVIHIHTHTFEFDKAIDGIMQRSGNPPLIFTLHQFIPYVVLPFKDKIRLLEGKMSRDELQTVRAKGYSTTTMTKKLEDGTRKVVFKLDREKAQERLMFRSDAIITICEGHKRAVELLYPEFKGKVHTICNGTSMHNHYGKPEVRDHAKMLRENFGSENKIIVYVGRYEQQKDINVVFRIFEKILVKHPNTKLVLVGPSESDRAKLDTQNIADRSKTKDIIYMKEETKKRIHFTGWVKGQQLLAGYYLMADLMIQPGYTQDLYSLAAIEAVAMGLPVIAAPGSLSVGDCMDDDTMVQTALKVFSNDKEIVDKMKLARTTFMNTYTKDTFMLKHLELYKKLKRSKK